MFAWGNSGLSCGLVSSIGFFSPDTQLSLAERLQSIDVRYKMKATPHQLPPLILPFVINSQVYFDKKWHQCIRPKRNWESEVCLSAARHRGPLNLGQRWVWELDAELSLSAHLFSSVMWSSRTQPLDWHAGLLLGLQKPKQKVCSNRRGNHISALWLDSGLYSASSVTANSLILANISILFI